MKSSDHSTNNNSVKQPNNPKTGALKKAIPLWSAIATAAGGAVVVGAVWGVTALQSHTGNHVIAKVGATSITQSDLVSKLESTGGTQTLQQMIDNQLIQYGAKKYNVTATQAEIQSALSNLESQYGISTTSQLNSLLQQNNMKLSDLTSALKLQVLEEKLAERNVKVTNKEIQSYYNANKSQFVATGSSKPQPLSKVKSQVVKAIKQSKAMSQSALFAQLAKSDGLTITDAKYKSLQSQITSAATAGTGNTAAGTASSTTSNAVAGSSSSNANSTSNAAQ